MNSRTYCQLHKAGPIGFVIAGLAVFAVFILGIGFNIYNAAEERITSLHDIALYWTENETAFLVVGVILFAAFLLEAWNLKRIKAKQEKANEICEGEM